MSNIVLLSPIDDAVRRFKKSAMLVLRADEKKLFHKHFDAYIAYLGEDKKDFAKSIKTLSRNAGPIIVRNMLEMFKIREEEGEENAKVGSTSDDSGSERQCDTMLPGVESGGNKPGDCGSGPECASTL